MFGWMSTRKKIDKLEKRVDMLAGILKAANASGFVTKIVVSPSREEFGAQTPMIEGKDGRWREARKGEAAHGLLVEDVSMRGFDGKLEDKFAYLERII